jgi:hypothetical protein
MEVSGQLQAPAALPPGKEPPVPFGEEAGWAPEPVWTQWWREKFPAPAGNWAPVIRSSSPLPVAVPTELQAYVILFRPIVQHLGLQIWWWWENLRFYPTSLTHSESAETEGTKSDCHITTHNDRLNLLQLQAINIFGLISILSYDHLWSTWAN